MGLDINGYGFTAMNAGAKVAEQVKKGNVPSTGISIGAKLAEVAKEKGTTALSVGAKAAEAIKDGEITANNMPDVPWGLGGIAWLFQKIGSLF